MEAGSSYIQKDDISIFLFFFCGRKVWTQGTMLARQVLLTTWATPPAYFCLGYFQGRVCKLFVPGLALNIYHPDLCLLSSWAWVTSAWLNYYYFLLLFIYLLSVLGIINSYFFFKCRPGFHSWLYHLSHTPTPHSTCLETGWLNGGILFSFKNGLGVVWHSGQHWNLLFCKGEGISRATGLSLESLGSWFFLPSPGRVGFPGKSSLMSSSLEPREAVFHLQSCRTQDRELACFWGVGYMWGPCVGKSFEVNLGSEHFWDRGAVSFWEGWRKQRDYYGRSFWDIHAHVWLLLETAIGQAPQRQIP
jgi:hypothetical protein